MYWKSGLSGGTERLQAVKALLFSFYEVFFASLFCNEHFGATRWAELSLDS